jgi:hypothetical protein
VKDELLCFRVSEIACFFNTIYWCQISRQKQLNVPIIFFVSHLKMCLLLQLHEPDLALAYCDRVYAPTNPGMRPNTASLASLALKPYPKDPAAANIYLTLLEVYLRPKAAIQEFDRSIASLAPVNNTVNQRATAAPRTRGVRKIAQIEDGKGQCTFLDINLGLFQILC